MSDFQEVLQIPRRMFLPMKTIENLFVVFIGLSE